MHHLCTITTADHMFKTLALYDSAMALDKDCMMHVLCIDTLPTGLPSGNIAFYSTEVLSKYPVAEKILSKYKASKDRIRWSLKPVFLNYLLDQKADKVIYLDNDIYLYDKLDFLFDLLDTYDFLLTPHNYPRDPYKDQNWLEANFRVGLYNAGFIGASKVAIPTLQWWAGCCAYRCAKSALRGTFDDQKYLDLIPVMDEKAHILRHTGCNVADWNRAFVSRSEINGKVMLNGHDPLVFIHFNGTTIRAIVKGEEPVLKNSFATYLDNLKKYKPTLKEKDLYKNQSLSDRVKLSIWKMATDMGF